jgi:hypothetical protein
MSHPVFISIGPKKVDTEIIKKAISLKEKDLGRPLTSTEILQTMGEVYEPDASKRTFISSRPPSKMPKLHLPRS